MPQRMSEKQRVKDYEAIRGNNYQFAAQSQHKNTRVKVKSHGVDPDPGLPSASSWPCLTAWNLLPRRLEHDKTCKLAAHINDGAAAHNVSLAKHSVVYRSAQICRSGLLAVLETLLPGTSWTFLESW